MSQSLIEALSQVEDFRAKRGQRYPLWVVLLLVIMGTMSGYQSYTALEEFVQRHRHALMEYFQLSGTRLPSDSSFRRVLMGVDFSQLASSFHGWASQYVKWDEARWYAVDGKSLKGTLKHPTDAQQNFVSMVSVFSVQRGVVVGTQQLSNQEGSEIATVQALLAALDLEGAIFSLDALHCQKKLYP